MGCTKYTISTVTCLNCGKSITFGHVYGITVAVKCVITGKLGQDQECLNCGSTNIKIETKEPKK